MRDPRPADFERIALDVFAHLFEAVPPYQAFCRNRGITPEQVRRWQDIPAVPAAAFKATELWCAPPQKIFRSSGTTRGVERRSRHGMPDLRLYRASAVWGLRRHLFADVEHRMPILSLVPPVRERPDSSLAQMVAWALEIAGDEDSLEAVRGGVADLEATLAWLRRREVTGTPGAILCTTAALVDLFERLRASDLRFRLPHGSRVMDTGGDKGVRRRLSRRALIHECWNLLAVPGYFVVNEYGMTELASQFYDNVLADRTAGRFRRRFKIGPPWVRTRIVDPATLEPVASGDPGLLLHVDLANAGSAVAVLTEDLGRAVGEGFEVLGRAPGAEPRGCGLAAPGWDP